MLSDIIMLSVDSLHRKEEGVIRFRSIVNIRFLILLVINRVSCEEEISIIIVKVTLGDSWCRHRHRFTSLLFLYVVIIVIINIIITITGIIILALAQYEASTVIELAHFNPRSSFGMKR